MRIKALLVASTLALSFFSCSVVSRARDNHQIFKAPQFDNLGSFHYQVSTGIPLAQRFFDQGLVLFYGFEWGESVRSFREATRLDPHCGMCYWGLALALGNKINAPLTGHEYGDAQSAIQKALSLKKLATPKEQDYIKALSLRFKHAPKLSNKVGPFSCHTSSSQHEESTPQELTAYSEAMQKIVKKYPQDNVAHGIFVYALFNRINWNFWDVKGNINPVTPTIIKTIQAILAKDNLDIGGNHYYIHVMESSSHPSDAMQSADRLNTLVPGSEHLVHMPAHIYFLTGRYHQASNSNLQAITTYQRYNETCKAQGFEPEINYLYFHNFDFLRSTAIMEGRKKLALWAAKNLIDKPFANWLARDATLQWFIPIPYYVEARFGLWKEILHEPMPSQAAQYALGMWHYARGLAKAGTGEIKAAKNELLQLQQIITKGTTDRNLGKAGHNLLKIAQATLMAIIANQQGDEKLTLAQLSLADKIQHDMGYHEPPDWYFPLKEIRGDAYLKWGHLKEAIQMYNEDLKQYPRNGWALYGLAKALRKIGKNQQAEQVEAEFKEAWKYADSPSPVTLFK
ncbi:MAG: hypothetical protein H0W64_04380 [Gammaproteobacteria bacterium]|nr:hypothetical protein [Gammaproteobacteria bacterium]